MLKHLSSIEQIKKRALELAAAGRKRITESRTSVHENDPTIKSAANDTSTGEQKTRSSLSFPLAPNGKVCAPNDMIRSSFFGAIERGERTRVADFEIVGPSGTTIFINGWRLDQTDAEIFFWLHDRAGGTQPGETLRFRLYDLLQHLGHKNPGGKNYERLKRRLEQMHDTTVRYRNGRSRGGVGSLISRFKIDEITNEAEVRTNPEMRGFFDAVTYLSTEHTAALRSSPLASWLYRAVVSSPEWTPMLVKTVLERSGSKSATLKHFKQNLIRALKRLQGQGYIHGYRFQPGAGGELLHIDRTPTLTQQRHIAKRLSR